MISRQKFHASARPLVLGGLSNFPVAGVIEEVHTRNLTFLNFHFLAGVFLGPMRNDRDILSDLGAIALKAVIR